MAKSAYYVVSHYAVEEGKKLKKVVTIKLPTLKEAREFGCYYIQQGTFVSLKNAKGTLLPV